MRAILPLLFVILAPTAQADDEVWVAWEQFRSQLETADTMYAAVTLHDVGLNPWSFVVRARREGPSGPQVVADPYDRAPNVHYFWDGDSAWRTLYREEPEREPAATALAAPLVASIFAGLPGAVVEERDPNADGWAIETTGPVVWAKVTPPEAMPEAFPYVYFAFSVHRPHPLQVVMLPGGERGIALTVSHLEWNVPIRDVAFVATATSPVALPPMQCWGNLRCDLPPPEELADRTLPNGQTIGRILDIEQGFFGLAPDGRQKLCHFPPGFPAHAHSLAVRTGAVKTHLAHGDQLHACPHQEEARNDPEDPPGQLTICHVPPGNGRARHQLRLPAAAIPAHLNHGDYLGPCWPVAQRGRAVEATAPEAPTPDKPSEAAASEAPDAPNHGGTGCLGCRSAPGPAVGWLPLLALAWRRRRG